MFNFDDLGSLPESLRGTYDMLRCAFPEGVPANEYKAMIALFEPYMSVRSLAILLTHFTEQAYPHCLHNVQEIWADGLSPEDAQQSEAVRQKLIPCGYDKWVEVEDY